MQKSNKMDTYLKEYSKQISNFMATKGDNLNNFQNSTSQTPTKLEMLSFFSGYIKTTSEKLLNARISINQGDRSTVFRTSNKLCMEKSARKKGVGARSGNSHVAKINNRQLQEAIIMPQRYIEQEILETMFEKITANWPQELKDIKYVQESWNNRSNTTKYISVGKCFKNLLDAKNRTGQKDLLTNVLNTVVQKVYARVFTYELKNIIQWMTTIELKREFLLAYKLWGKHLTIKEFNRIADNYLMIKQLLSESPMIGWQALRLSAMLGVNKIEQDALGKIKSTLYEKGITKSAWKMLGKVNKHYLKHMLGQTLSYKSIESMPSFEFTLNTYIWTAHTQITPETLNMWCAKVDAMSQYKKISTSYNHIQSNNVYSTIMSILKNNLPSLTVNNVQEAQAFINDYNAKINRLPQFFKSLVEHILNRAESDVLECSLNFRNDFNQVFDYLTRSELGTWVTFPEKLTWAVMWRRQLDWHEAILEEEKGKHNRHKWSSLVDKLEEDEWEALALNNGGALWEEGKLMHHCVSTYAHTCATQDCRIYSIRKNESRIGTLEIRRSSKTKEWETRQFNGYCNARITNQFALTFVNKLLEQYNKAQKKADLEELNKKQELKLKLAA